MSGYEPFSCRVLSCTINRCFNIGKFPVVFQNLWPNENGWGAFIEACYDFFLNEMIEYYIMNEESVRFFF